MLPFNTAVIILKIILLAALKRSILQIKSGLFGPSDRATCAVPILRKGARLLLSWPLGGCRAVRLGLRLLVLELVELLASLAPVPVLWLLRFVVEVLRALGLVHMLVALAGRAASWLLAKWIGAAFQSLIIALLDDVTDFPLVRRLHVIVEIHSRILVVRTRVVGESRCVPLLVVYRTALV